VHKDIVLEEKDDSIIILDIKTANDQQYSVSIEIQQRQRPRPQGARLEALVDKGA